MLPFSQLPLATARAYNSNYAQFDYGEHKLFKSCNHKLCMPIRFRTNLFILNLVVVLISFPLSAYSAAKINISLLFFKQPINVAVNFAFFFILFYVIAFILGAVIAKYFFKQDLSIFKGSP